MKKLVALLVFTACIATAGWANNTPDHNGDPDPEKKEGQYTFSLTKAYFSFFNLFTVDAVESDSLKTREEELPREEELELKFLPLWP